MRSLLVHLIILVLASNALLAQSDFVTLDKRSYDYYLKGDFKNLKKTSDSMLSYGMDYYYLRMRLGIGNYNKQRYSAAVNHLNKALEFNSLDTISRELIYKSYLFAGRLADANLYLESLSLAERNNTLKLLGKPVFSSIHLGSSASTSSVTFIDANNQNNQMSQNNLIFNAGFESFFSSSFKGIFAYRNLRKNATILTSNGLSGNEINVNQNQVYAKFSGYAINGWEFTGFGHIAFYTDVISTKAMGNETTSTLKHTEYLGGASISKNLWRLRLGANLSSSSFGYSNQLRGEGYLTWLPFGNLNLYLTSGGLYQSDANWGNTYQINQEIGVKVFKFLWFETGAVIGNSFLYARNQGYEINNSFEIPAKTIYGNFIVLAGKNLSINLSAFFIENQIYSYDFNSFTRKDKITSNSFGGAIKLIFKIK